VDLQQALQLVYTAGALLVAATLAYRILTRGPLTRLNLAGLAAALAAVMATAYFFNLYYNPALEKIKRDLASLELSAETLLHQYAEPAAHASVAASIVFTALWAFVGGPALAYWAADILVESAEEALSAAAWYLHYAHAVLSVALCLALAAPATAAAVAPLAAAKIKDKRAVLISAFALAVPLMIAVAAYTAPPLPPHNATGLYVEPRIQGAVSITVLPRDAQEPVVVELAGQQPAWVNEGQGWREEALGAYYWYTVKPPGATALLPEGEWTTTRYIYMWVQYPLRQSLRVIGNWTWANCTLTLFTGGATACGVPRPSGSVAVSLPHEYRRGWSIAATPRPHEDSGSRLLWDLVYDCYGTCGECGDREWHIRGMAAELRGVEGEVLEEENAAASHSEGAAPDPSAVGEDEWLAICQAADSTWLRRYLERLGVRTQCGEWHHTHDFWADVRVSCVPCTDEQGNEVPCTHYARVQIRAHYQYVGEPAVFGAYYGNRTTRELADDVAYQAYRLLAEEWPEGGPAISPLAPVAWIWQSLVPYVEGLVLRLVTVIAGVAGVMVLAGAGAPAVRVLGLHLLTAMRWRLGWMAGLPWRAVREAGLRLRGTPGQALAPASVPAAREAAGAAAARWAPQIRQWALYMASAGRWGALFYSDLWAFAAAGIGALAVAARELAQQLRLARSWLEGLRAVPRALGRGLHLVATPPREPLAPAERLARRVDAFLDWLYAAVRLRPEWPLIAHYASVYRAAREMGAPRLLAALWTAAMHAPPRHPGDLAAFAALHGIKCPMLAATPSQLREGFERAASAMALEGVKLSEEEAARLWLKHHGYDYPALARAVELGAIRGVQRPQDLALYLPLRQFRELLAARAASLWLSGRGDLALLLASVPEARQRLRELGVRVTPEGAAEPDWGAWLRGAGALARAVREGRVPLERAVEIALVLPPGPMGQRLELYEPLHVDPREHAALRALARAARRALGELVESGEIPRELERGLAERLASAVEGVIPRELALRGAYALLSDPRQLRELARLAGSERPRLLESLPPHVQEGLWRELPYGDPAYLRPERLLRLAWREAEAGRVVERRAADLLPPRAREAVQTAAIRALDLPLPEAPPRPEEAKAAELQRAAEVLRRFGLDEVRPEDALRALGSAERLRELAVDAIRAAEGSLRYHDEGLDLLSLPLERQAEELRRMGISATPEALARIYLSHREELERLAGWQRGLLERRLEEARRLIGELARPEEPGRFERVEGLEERVAEPFRPVADAVREELEGAAPAGEEVLTTPEDFKIAPERVLERRAEEALRRLGIDAAQLEARALAERHGLPEGVAREILDEYGRYADRIAEDVARVRDWLLAAGIEREAAERVIAERLHEIARSPEAFVERAARELASRVPHPELRDLVAEDLRRGRFEEAQWKLREVERLCAERGGCAPGERRELYKQLSDAKGAS
jgi:hypothetical protein